MLDPNKMTVQYRKVLSRHPSQWYFVSPKDPTLAWRHRYKHIKQQGTFYLPNTFPSHPVRQKFLIQDISTAHFRFTRFSPHDLFINITSGENEYRIDDGGAAFVHGHHRLRIYEAHVPMKNGVIYRTYPQINGKRGHNEDKNLRIMMYHLCVFTNQIMSLIS